MACFVFTLSFSLILYFSWKCSLQCIIFLPPTFQSVGHWFPIFFAHTSCSICLWSNDPQQQYVLLSSVPSAKLLNTLLHLVCIVVTSCVLLNYVCTAVLYTSVAGLLARSQYPEGPATGHLGTDFLGFPVSIREGWDGSQDCKLLLPASHVALPT